MFFRRSADTRHYTVSDDAAVDFCVWVLEVDGPRAPPFDRHEGGDGRLRAAGLAPGAW